MPPEPVVAAGGVNLKKQAAAVRDPVPPRSLWQSANDYVNCGSVRAKTPFTPPPQVYTTTYITTYTTTYTTTIFCLPGFCRDAMGRPDSRKPTALQWVSGISETSREPLEIPVLSSEAERVGFEPTDPCGSPVFKTGAINHSTTSPGPGLARGLIFPPRRPMLPAGVSLSPCLSRLRLDVMVKAGAPLRVMAVVSTNLLAHGPGSWPT